MKLYEKKVYECEYCGKISKSAGAMTLHERRCRKNPNVRPLCWKCKHCHSEYNGLEQKTEAIEWLQGYTYTGGEIEGSCVLNVVVCDCDKKKMFNTLGIKNENLQEELLNRDWKCSPTESEGCEHFKNMYIEPNDIIEF